MVDPRRGVRPPLAREEARVNTMSGTPAPVGPTDGRMAHLGRGAGGNLTRPSKESPLDSKVTLFYHC